MSHSSAPTVGTQPFQLRDCSLVVQSTGLKAVTLAGFQENLQQVDAASIYHHFWGRFLEPRFDEPEYNNDFASWTYRALHEKALAERLSMIDPAAFTSMEQIREEVIGRIAEHLNQHDYMPWARADQHFYFLKSQIVVFDTGRYLEHPADLLTAIHTMSLGSIFYHFIDARRRTGENCDDFSAWLRSWGTEFDGLRRQLTAIDPFFASLKEIRRRVRQALLQTLQGGAA